MVLEVPFIFTRHKTINNLFSLPICYYVCSHLKPKPKIWCWWCFVGKWKTQTNWADMTTYFLGQEDLLLPPEHFLSTCQSGSVGSAPPLLHICYGGCLGYVSEGTFMHFFSHGQVPIINGNKYIPPFWQLIGLQKSDQMACIQTKSYIYMCR